MSNTSSANDLNSNSWWHYALLMTLAALLLLVNLSNYPDIWFDEGYKTNAARTLAERGVYGTYSIQGYNPFDPGISSGPADLIPVALSFKYFGYGVAEARIVSVIFTGIAVVFLYRIGVYLYGRMAALFISLFAIAVPDLGNTGFLLIGRQILGEPAALCLTLAGLWLWFKSWREKSIPLSIFAGAVIGLGMLSKTQVAIALLPALALIGLLRWWNNRSGFMLWFSPPVLVVAVFAGWMLVGNILTPAHIRVENSALLKDAIQTNLLTPLLGSTLTPQAIVLAGMMVIGASYGGWRILRQPGRTLTHERWAEMTLGVFVFFYAVWYALLSLGWTRYAYVGLVVSLILVGKLVWDMVVRVTAQSTWSLSLLYPFLIGGMVAVAVASNIIPVLETNTINEAEAVGGYIDANIAQDSVIETWDWEVDALSHHWEFHHPHQSYLFEAIRQLFHEKIPFDLGYDVLEANPDYLIIGTFSRETMIYDMQTVEANFDLLAKFGHYEIYERKRE